MKKLLILVVLDLLGGNGVSTHLTKTVVVRIDAEEKVVDETVTEEAASIQKSTSP